MEELKSITRGKHGNVKMKAAGLKITNSYLSVSDKKGG